MIVTLHLPKLQGTGEANFFVFLTLTLLWLNILVSGGTECDSNKSYKKIVILNVLNILYLVWDP